jgi:hypothetical protein
LILADFDPNILHSAQVLESMMQTLLRSAAFAVLLSIIAGCGDAKLGQVSGTVTLDGEPLPRATVEFQPTTGSPSYGITDDSGRYRLIYLRNKPGALIGEHIVRVTTYDWVTNPDESKTEIPERVPRAYNEASTLAFTVKRGSQTFDLILSSE